MKKKKIKILLISMIMLSCCYGICTQQICLSNQNMAEDLSTRKDDKVCTEPHKILGHLYKEIIMESAQKEEWQRIKKWPSYEVSNFGRVKSHKGLQPRILKCRLTQFGYYAVILYDENHKPKQNWVHRLVLTAFISQPTPNQQAHHKNGTKTDNRLENLEWVTRSENIKHAHTTGLIIYTDERKKKVSDCLRGERHPNAKMTDDDVREIKILLKAKVKHRIIANQFNVTRSAIKNISRVKGRAWKHIK